MTKMQTTNPTYVHVQDVARQTGMTVADVQRIINNFQNAVLKYDNRK